MKKLNCILCLVLMLFFVSGDLSAKDPYNTADDSWITLSGVVVSSDPGKFFS
ncbi:MAG: hypothetical protein ACQETH_11170 [Candidatus Rifleibacteriota bacterium]